MPINKLTDEQRWCPDVDPFSRYPLFMWLEHPELGYVPTYGGPYDSYTLTELDENGEFFRHRFDHDRGCWVEDEYIGLIVVEDWLPRNEKELNEHVRDNQLSVVPKGWKLVPIEPTEEMIVEGFESRPDESFSKPEVWEEYAAMSGCKQAAHRAKLCWAAMLAAAPVVRETNND